IDLASYPNLALKWCHAPTLLSDQAYPHRDVLPFLRRVIDSFALERVMWASDYTQARAESNQAWAQVLYYLFDSDMLKDSEDSWILGRSVRQALRWPHA